MQPTAIPRARASARRFSSVTCAGTNMEEDKMLPDFQEKTIENDPDLQKKRQLMLERLSARHQSRIDNSLARRSDSSEPTAAFLSRFSESKRSIDSQLAEARNVAVSDPSAVKSHLAAVSNSIGDLEKLVAENAYLLPSYEVRSSLKSVSDLKQDLEILSSELLPKKKFAFKNRATVKTEALKQSPVESSVGAPKRDGFGVRDSPGFRNRTNETLVKRFVGADIGEFTLSELDSCEVRLSGCFNALFVNRLKKCKIYSGPVMGSVLIEDVEDCVFVLASHQIRIHLAKQTDFYLRVRSRPIIEDSSGLRFAPYCLEYEGIKEELEAAGLSEETGNWGNVDDFKWLRAVQSPNWCVLPEHERIKKVCFREIDMRHD